jgi:hypothetical protein
LRPDSEKQKTAEGCRQNSAVSGYFGRETKKKNQLASSSTRAGIFVPDKRA